VNPNTVQRAYTLLEEKGLIRSIPKKGAFVLFSEESKDDTFEALTAELLRLKTQGVSKGKIISIVEEVYTNDHDQ
jgi:DNA-binding transcriptional regulator YhcF (GntR family)